VDIRDHKLQIWPGYRTTIAQHENAILMVAEITHKVIRLDTVLHLLQDIQANSRGHYRNAFSAEIIGQIVLTDYNNKTYRINDINWELNPTSTFPRNGENVSYVDYYKQVRIVVQSSYARFVKNA
jgi:aubergine